MNSTTISTNTNSMVNSTVDSAMNSRPTPRLTSTVSRVLALSTPVTHQIYAGLRWCLPGRGRTLATTPDAGADGQRLSGDRGAVEPVEAGRMIEQALEGSPALADVAVSVERTPEGVTVAVNAQAPGMLIGTGRDLRVVEFVPESGWVE